MHQITKTLLFLSLFVGNESLALAQGPKPVVVTKVIEKVIKSGRKVVGTVHPSKRSTIGSAAEGRVKSFLVNPGQRVKKGETLAQIRTETLLIEQAAAEAELELAKQRLIELKNGAREEDKLEAQANMTGAKAAYEIALNNWQRLSSLSDTDATSDRELDDAKEKRDVAKALYEAAKAVHKRILDGTRKEIVAQAAAQVELQQQKVNLIVDRISKYTIVAPFEGFVAAEFTEEGAWIKQGDPVVELIQINMVEIHAPATAETALHLKRGTLIRLEFPELAELPKKPPIGKILRIVPSTASRARTFPIHIELANKFEEDKPLLFAGMLARADFPAGPLELLPLVPKDALVLNGKQRSVFVVDSVDGATKARKVEVELGVAVDNLIQIRGDLKVNELVVIVGNERLSPGAAVKIIREEQPAEEELSTELELPDDKDRPSDKEK